VTEFVPLADVQAQRVFSERRAFEQATGLTRIGLALPGHYPRLLELIRAYAERQALGEPSAGAGPALRQAAARWDAEVFQPLQRQIRAQRLGQHFPGERTADVFLRVADYRRDESERQGRELSWDEALQGFAAAQRARHASTDGAG
jgi:hypothetical protein